MRTFLVMLLTIIMVHDMQSSQLMPKYNLLEQQLIEQYIKINFNVIRKNFEASTVCTLYESANLKGNIEQTTIMITKQAAEKNILPTYYDGLKDSEKQLKYAVYLESFYRYLPKIVKAIKKHCTLPLSYLKQEKLLCTFWYAHWALILPENVQNKSVKPSKKAVPTPQKKLLCNFIEACQKNKALFISKKPISCYMLCASLAEQFFKIAQEVGAEKHPRIGNTQDVIMEMHHICQEAGLKCEQLLSTMRPIHPWTMPIKREPSHDIYREINNYLIFFWNSFWKKPHGDLEFKQEQIKSLEASINKAVADSFYDASLV